MNGLYQDKLNRSKSVLHHMYGHKDIWADDPMISETVASLADCISGLDEILQVQAVDLESLYAARDQQAASAYEAVELIASSVRAWARKNEPAQLLKFRLPKSTTLAKKRGEVVGKLRTVMEDGISLLPRVTGHKLKESDLSAARVAIAKLESDNDTIRTMIAHRKNAGARSRSLTNGASDAVTTLVDLMPYCQGVPQVFIGELRVCSAVKRTRRKARTQKAGAENQVATNISLVEVPKPAADVPSADTPMAAGV